jgi:hypothetical protein
MQDPRQNNAANWRQKLSDRSHVVSPWEPEFYKPNFDGDIAATNSFLDIDQRKLKAALTVNTLFRQLVIFAIHHAAAPHLDPSAETLSPCREGQFRLSAAARTLSPSDSFQAWEKEMNIRKPTTIAFIVGLAIAQTRSSKGREVRRCLARVWNGHLTALPSELKTTYGFTSAGSRPPGSISARSSGLTGAQGRRFIRINVTLTPSSHY